jgi:adenylate cyclase, class 2
MQTEIEAKFLQIDHAVLRERLLALGAVCTQPMRLMRRAIIDYPDRRLQMGEINSFVRVRDEGNRVTVTYKQFETLGLSGAQEIETEVASFAATVAIFEAIGLVVTSLQETRRETWELTDCEVVLDEWPWLPPYIEIEGSHEASVQAVATSLGLDWSDAVFGYVMVAYRAAYPHLTPQQTVGTLPEVRFDLPLPAMFTVAS